MLLHDIDKLKLLLANHPYGRLLLEGPIVIEIHKFQGLILDIKEELDREMSQLEHATAAARASLQPDWDTAHAEAVARQRLARAKATRHQIQESAQ